ncbi:MAG: SGNH/GDSL hydrolase family protein [Alistipes sp.]|nr:SGNH/GDSL hydrolase family protein [Alistipes sp.]
MKRVLIALALIGFVSSASAEKWVDARDLAIHGHTQKCEQHPYHRIDHAATNLNKKLATMAEEAAGLYVTFKTNSSFIAASWSIVPHKTRDNMSMIIQRGLDLYIKQDGEWRYAQSSRITPEPAVTSYKKLLVKRLPKEEKEFMLYLPGWSEVKSLQIGIEEGATIEGTPSPFRHKVVVYGSSITHGACASRAGMTYTAIMSRNLGIDFINFGFAGQCMMQPEFLEILQKCEADAFIFDTFSNPSAKVIEARLANFVEGITKAHPGKPLIFIQSAIPLETCVDPGKRAKRELRFGTAARIMKELQKQHKDIYLLDVKDVIGKDGSADNTHPNDLGFSRFVDTYQPKIAKILRKYGIK